MGAAQLKWPRDEAGLTVPALVPIIGCTPPAPEAGITVRCDGPRKSGG